MPRSYRFISALAAVALAAGASTAFADGGHGRDGRDNDNNNDNNQQNVDNDVVSSDVFGSMPNGPVLFGAAPGQSQRAGDQIGVHAQFVGFAHQLDQVAAQQRFPAGQVQLQHAQLLGFDQHPQPFLGAQLVAVVGQVQGVGAVRAGQRTPVGELGQQSERPIHR